MHVDGSVESAVPTDQPGATPDFTFEANESAIPPEEEAGPEAPPQENNDFLEELEQSEQSKQAEDEAPVEKVDFFADELEPPPVYEPEPTGRGGSSDLSDIARFGNSDVTGSRDGSLRYNLLVEGIDTSDVREAFREALTDRKFVWDTDDILRTIQNGAVRIENVVASKAFVLVSRLRALPVRISWEQYAVQSN